MQSFFTFWSPKLLHYIIIPQIEVFNCISHVWAVSSWLRTAKEMVLASLSTVKTRMQWEILNTLQVTNYKKENRTDTLPPTLRNVLTYSMIVFRKSFKIWKNRLTRSILPRYHFFFFPASLFYAQGDICTQKMYWKFDKSVLSNFICHLKV